MEDPKNLKDAVKMFYKNKGTEINRDDIIVPKEENSIVDAKYKKIEFQITNVPADAEEVDGRLNKERKVETKNVKGKYVKVYGTEVKMTEYGYSEKEVWEMFVKKPIENKINTYGKFPEAAKTMILLLFARSTSEQPFIEEQTVENLKKNQENLDFLEEAGFKEIYLVSDAKNIKLYPQQKSEKSPLLRGYKTEN